MRPKTIAILFVALSGLLPAIPANAEERGVPQAVIATIQDWVDAVESKIDQSLLYPSRPFSGYQEGTAKVRFHLDGNGLPAGATLVKSSGSSDLDREALRVLSRIGYLPSLPSVYPRAQGIVLQVRFGTPAGYREEERENNLVVAMRTEAMQQNIMSAAGAMQNQDQ